MDALIILTFITGYFFIALEHPLKIDKAASAILTGVVCWTILVIGQQYYVEGIDASHGVNEQLLHHVGEIAEILFFLLGAMTIVELMDAHDCFDLITQRVTTADKVKLLWMICLVTFFFSAILDNLTTSIVMATLLKKLLVKKEDIWFFAGMVIVAANAGGAWSPIGDITTIMLWVGGQITAVNIIYKIFIPSVFCLLIPLIVVSWGNKGQVQRNTGELDETDKLNAVSPFEKGLIFYLGVGGLLFVPIFKNITHLPPFMGILFSLGVLWVTTEIVHRNKIYGKKIELSVAEVIRRIDTPSILFFLGILLAVASLQTAGHLSHLANYLDNSLDNIYAVNVLVGLLSAIVDNVPLVAGAMGMYPIDIYPQDHRFWELLAYCAGTGGSALIIGSAAGVAIMGILKIDFIWYMKKISGLALLGYFTGVLVYYFLF